MTKIRRLERTICTSVWMSHPFCLLWGVALVLMHAEHKFASYLPTMASRQRSSRNKSSSADCQKPFSTVHFDRWVGRKATINHCVLGHTYCWHWSYAQIRGYLLGGMYGLYGTVRYHSSGLRTPRGLSWKPKQKRNLRILLLPRNRSNL